LVFDRKSSDSILWFKESFRSIFLDFGLRVRHRRRTVGVFGEKHCLDGSFFKNILNLAIRCESLLSIGTPGSHLKGFVITLK
jgi:hypothetical protein